MVTFVIVRHGLSVFNKEKRFTGQLDIPLTETGVRQAELTAAHILQNYHIDCIWSSDSCRAQDTARPVADALGLDIHITPELREVNAGCWQGRTIEDLKKEYPEEFGLWRSNVGMARAGDGESSAEVIVRAARIFEKIAAENEGKTVLVTTHGGMIRSIRCHWLGIPLEEMKNLRHVSNASITVAHYDNGSRTAELVQVGYDEHLNGTATEFVIN